MKKKYLILLVVGSTLAFGACKKSKSESATGDRTELSLDSIFLYAKEIYYWNNQLPSYASFNPRKYNTGSTALEKYEAELFGIAGYSTNKYDVRKSNGVYQNVPKYSYIEDQADKNPSLSVRDLSSVDTEGNGNDIGIRFQLFGNTSSYKIFVSAVYNNSPAKAAGFVRGDVITKINGVSYGTNYPGDAAINAVLNGSTLRLEGERLDGTTFDKTLEKTIFKSNHIYKVQVLTAGSKKIGYLAYARFGALSTPPTLTTAAADVELDAAFNQFANAGVTDLIIDLRYNGGGYVYAAEHLTNLIAPSSVRGTMFTEYFNSTMQSGNAKILSNQPLLDAAGNIRYNSSGKMLNYSNVDYAPSANTTSFAKKGNLNNVANVVFLVTGNTASASELVINNLKPHVNVKVVGQTTYGKPIGFFPITIENKYDVWLSLFVTKNSLGQGGDYFEGMSPDLTVASELSNATINGVAKTSVMFDFGNPNDAFLKAALNLLAPGVTVNGQLSTPVVTKDVSSISAPATTLGSGSFGTTEFKGMIETRFKIKN